VPVASLIVGIRTLPIDEAMVEHRYALDRAERHNEVPNPMVRWAARQTRRSVYTAPPQQ
jgi:hypothetical protein